MKKNIQVKQLQSSTKIRKKMFCHHK